MSAENEALRLERDQLEAEVNRLTEQLAAEERSHRPTLVDYSAVRDRILEELKVGKQSSEYKRTKALLDQFIASINQATGFRVG